MNTDTIGLNAGSVWAALNEAEALGTKQLKKIAKNGRKWYNKIKRKKEKRKCQ